MTPLSHPQSLAAALRPKRNSQIVPPINKRIRYKGKLGMLLNDYGSDVVYFRMDGDNTISCDLRELIEIIQP